jgi:citrate lyase alpha subunit
MESDKLYEDLENDYVMLINILSKDKNLSLSVEEIKNLLSLDNYMTIALHHKFEKSEILIDITKFLIIKKKNMIIDSIITELPENLTKKNLLDVNDLVKMNNKEKMTYINEVRKEDEERELEELRKKKPPLSEYILTLVFIIIIFYAVSVR